MRGPLLPPTVPGWRSRAERFDMAVLEAYEPIERRWQERVAALDVAVDEIPRHLAEGSRQCAVAAGGGGRRADRAGPVDTRRRGRPRELHAGANCVVPQADRAASEGHRSSSAELLHELLVAQVATYLGVEPSVIDPTIDDD